MIYFFVLVIIALLGIKYDLNGKKTNILCGVWMVLFLLIMIAGLRFLIGSDTINYFTTFKQTPPINLISYSSFYNTRYQPGFVTFVSLCRFINDNFVVLQLFHAIIINICIYRFIKNNSRIIFLPLAFYLIINYLEFNTEILRESLSIAVSLSAFEFLKRKKYIAFSLAIFIALNFHISAVIVIIYPLCNIIKYSNKQIIAISAISLILPFLYSKIPGLSDFLNGLLGQDELVNRYSSQELNQDLNVFYFLFLFFRFAFIPLWILNVIHRNYGEFKYTGFIYAYIILQVLGMYSYAFYRFANYFVPFYWILLGEFTYLSINRNAQTRKLKLASLCFILSIVIMVYQRDQLKFNPNTYMYQYERYFPYKSVISIENTYK